MVLQVAALFLSPLKGHGGGQVYWGQVYKSQRSQFWDWPGHTETPGLPFLLTFWPFLSVLFPTSIIYCKPRQSKCFDTHWFFSSPHPIGSPVSRKGLSSVSVLLSSYSSWLHARRGGTRGKISQPRACNVPLNRTFIAQRTLCLVRQDNTAAL